IIADGLVYLVDLIGALLSRYEIRGAELVNSTITQAQLDEACEDSTTKMPTGVVVRQACISESWVESERAKLQEKTYAGGVRAPEACDKAALSPVWR
ncbi:MAG: hypothetical protein ACJ8C8_06895, partial [Microvirga sp.]